MTEAEKLAERQRGNTKRLFKKLIKSFQTPPDMTVSEWADAYRMLSPESSAEPGRWRTDRAPYQRAIMDALADDRCYKVVVMSSAQVGKALDIHTPILTDCGWKTMGELCEGDVVFDEQGEPCNVVATTPIMQNRPCYEVTFSDGAMIVADENHEWYVESDTALDVQDVRGERYIHWRGMRHGILTTKEIAASYKYGKTLHRNRYAIPVASAVRFEEKKLPIDPYVLGVWLGDGNSYSAQITAHKDDNQIVEELNRRCDHILLEDRGSTWNVKLEPRALCNVTMYNKLSRLGEIANKHIPKEYLMGSVEQRLELLQGLMDTDGCCNQNGRCEITLKSKKLIDGVSALLHSLGIKHTLHTKIAQCTNAKQDYSCMVYRISFLVYDDTPVFKLKRKLNRLVSREGRRSTETYRRRIVEVKKVASREVRCIQVDSPSHLYLAGESLIPTHNSEVILNSIGYYIDYDPAPMMYVLPTDSMAATFSKDRVSPMIRDTPTLKRKVEDSKSRNSGNTIFHKKFEGGHLTFIGANAPSQLASRPIRILFADEIDRFPDSAGAEGDPLQLAIKRTTTFWNRKIIEVSTPTIKGASKIEKEYEASSMEHLNVACPHCGKYQTYEWEQLKFDHVSGTQEFTMLGYKCRYCDVIEREVLWKKQPIKWIAEHPERKDVRGFHLNEMASPWKSWDEIVEDFLEAKRQGKEMLKVWHNTSLGLPWEESGDLDIKDILLKRREFYNCTVPLDALVLTCAVDVQDNRLEYEIVGWGKDKISFGIKYGVIYGDPGTDEVWAMLDDVLFANYKRSDGLEMQIMTTCIDSGGHHTERVYRYCRKREMRRVWAIKGQGGSGIPFIKRPTKRNASGAFLFMVGVDVGKDMLSSRLKTNFVNEPGFCHFPMEDDRGYDEQYFNGLTAERRDIRTVSGSVVIKWVKKYEGIRNEPFDLRNYNTAALEILNPNLDALYRRLNEEGGGGKIATPAPKKTRKVSKGISVY